MKCQECRWYSPISYMKRGECKYPTPYWCPDRGTIKGDQFVMCKVFEPKVEVKVDQKGYQK